MQKFTFFIGIDISKKTLDFSVVKTGHELFHLTTSNNEKGIALFMDKLRQLPQFELNQALFCMEYTGLVRHEVARFEYG